ncbi:hypothetical protein MJO28_009028, partial [Puccinia striiformis f. sp. tritici]
PRFSIRQCCFLVLLNQFDYFHEPDARILWWIKLRGQLSLVAFGNLVETFQTFFQQAFSSSTSSLSTMISPNFAPVI